MTKQRVKRRLPRIFKCPCGTYVYQDRMAKPHKLWSSETWVTWVRFHDRPDGEHCGHFTLRLDRR